MVFSETFAEDLLANALLGAVLIAVTCARDLCKRVSRSDCVYDNGGLKIKLPTFHSGGNSSSSSSGDPDHHPSPL